MKTDEQKAKQRAYAAAWRERNVEKARAATMKCYYERNYKDKYRTAHKEYSKNNRDSDNDWRKHHPLQYAITRARHRAKTKGIDFDITVDDFDTIPSHCPILGVELIPVSRTKEEKDCVMSIDRIDSTQGYTKGNVAIISWKANRLKNALSIDQMKKFIDLYEGATK